ncbi:hypothetical protein BN1723_007802 [Verticillium longisporum]|uniref:Uncharacterized protein n=1 Tax=Verticillium longisporum TaxID=100787 RepID=A0A0G4NN61_VERLO|nr:hypothetical protein BN1723_007802 [Verticillium longisporum]
MARHMHPAPSKWKTNQGYKSSAFFFSNPSLHDMQCSMLKRSPTTPNTKNATSLALSQLNPMLILKGLKSSRPPPQMPPTPPSR